MAAAQLFSWVHKRNCIAPFPHAANMRKSQVSLRATFWRTARPRARHQTRPSRNSSTWSPARPAPTSTGRSGSSSRSCCGRRSSALRHEAGRHPAGARDAAANFPARRARAAPRSRRRRAPQAIRPSSSFRRTRPASASRSPPAAMACPRSTRRICSGVRVPA